MAANAEERAMQLAGEGTLISAAKAASLARFNLKKQ